MCSEAISRWNWDVSLNSAPVPASVNATYADTAPASSCAWTTCQSIPSQHEVGAGATNIPECLKVERIHPGGGRCETVRQSVPKKIVYAALNILCTF